MQNLEQQRAASALSHARECRKKDGEGDCLAGYPGLLINNGLLSCIAYSISKEKQHQRVADAIAKHIAQMGICAPGDGGNVDAEWLLKHLSAERSDARTLRRATSEALAFLGYLKRFAKLETQPQGKAQS